jgi:hypothetical protein
MESTFQEVYVNALWLNETPSAIARSGRSGGALRCCCWGSSRWSHSLHTDRWGEVHKLSAGRRGTTSRIRPSADALALVGKELWAREATFYGSSGEIDTVKVPREFVERLTDAVCYAA